MSAIKCRREYKTLLDFSDTDKKISKNLVKQLLRKAEVITYKTDGDYATITSYDIIVGSYRIRLILNTIVHYGGAAEIQDHKHLKEYGSFFIELHEKKCNTYTLINTGKDIRFKDQYWSNFAIDMRTTDLVNAVMHCKRLNQLKAFL